MLFRDTPIIHPSCILLRQYVSYYNAYPVYLRKGAMFEGPTRQLPPAHAKLHCPTRTECVLPRTKPAHWPACLPVRRGVCRRRVEGGTRGGHLTHPGPQRSQGSPKPADAALGGEQSAAYGSALAPGRSAQRVSCGMALCRNAPVAIHLVSDGSGVQPTAHCTAICPSSLIQHTHRLQAARSTPSTQALTLLMKYTSQAVLEHGPPPGAAADPSDPMPHAYPTHAPLTPCPRQAPRASSLPARLQMTNTDRNECIPTSH